MTARPEAKVASFLRSMWSAFSSVPPLQRLIVIVGLFIASVFELFGLATLVPLIVLMTPDDGAGIGGQKGMIRDTVAEAFAAVGLPMTFVGLLFVILMFLTIKAAVGILVMNYVSGIMTKLNTEARLGVIRTLMQARWSFYTRQRLSRLVAAAGESANAVGDAFQISADLLTSFLRVLAYLAICYVIAPAMVLVAAVVAVIMTVSYGQLVRRSKRALKAQNKAMAQMKADLTDVFVGIKSIRAMGRQAQMSTLLAADSENLDERTKSRVLSTEYAEELQAPLIAGSLVLGLAGGSAFLNLGGHELLLMAILLVRMVNTFGFVQRATYRLRTTNVWQSSAKRLMAEAEASQEVFLGKVVPDPRQGVRFVDVSFKHADGSALLVGADFIAETGKITSLIGPSGIGKTTALDLILGLLAPRAGSVILGGVDALEVDLLKWRQMLGYVPQEVTLFHDTIRNNVALGEATYTDEDVWRALRAAGADEFIEALPLGLEHVVGERGQMISGGQRQRIALARALLHRPAILVLDEATAGIDRETESGICARIREMVDKDGLTVISVSHGEAWRNIADRVYKLGDGKLTVVEPGSSAEVVPLGKPGPSLIA